MYFAIDIDNKLIQDDDGNTYTDNEFRSLIERDADKDIFHDMTQMTARFLRYNYNWERLEECYKT